VPPIFFTAQESMPRKIVINRKYGGFCLTQNALNNYNQRTGKQLRAYHDIPRDDPDLIHVIEEMGLDAAADGMFCKLAIIEIPDDVPEDGWEIQDYDGVEWVAEKHRRWS